MKIKSSSTSPNLSISRKWESPRPISLSSQIEVRSGSEPVPVIINDSLNDYRAATVTINKFSLSVNVDQWDELVTLEVLDPHLVSLDSNENITRLADGGLARITVSAKWGPTYALNLNMGEFVDGLDFYDNTGVIAGSLIHHINDQSEALLMEPSSDKKSMFLVNNHTTKTYSRNPSNFLAAYQDDLTGISVYNSSTRSRRKCGVLITPRHVAVVNHYLYGVGTTVAFLNTAGQLEERAVVKVIHHPNPSTGFGLLDEYVILLMDSDYSSLVKPMSLVPVMSPDYLDPDTSRSTGFALDADRVAHRTKFQAPYFCTDQEGKILVRNLSDPANVQVNDSIVRYNFGSYSPLRDEGSDPAGNRSVYYEDLISGDSGQAFFALIEGRLRLMGMATWGGWGWGNLLGGKPADLNQMIADVDASYGIDTGYTVEMYDPSVWPNLITNNYIIEDSDLANGNASLWVEDGIVNDKMSYKMRLSATEYKHLLWEESAWNVYDYTGDEITETPFDSSSDDVATPDLATFATLNFDTP